MGHHPLSNGFLQKSRLERWASAPWERQVITHLYSVADKQHEKSPPKFNFSRLAHCRRIFNVLCSDIVGRIIPFATCCFAIASYSYYAMFSISAVESERPQAAAMTS
jgi:hypothetical protein